jgi:hypothetical protein
VIYPPICEINSGRLIIYLEVYMQTKYRFIELMDVDNNGLLSEVAIVKRFPNGDIYFIPLQSLDAIDLQRLKIIITHQDAALYDELWKLLEQRTLGNGMNALIYFNQVVKHRTPNGQILNYGSGKLSYTIQQPVTQQPQPNVQQAPAAPVMQAPAEPESFDAIAKPTGNKAK